MAFPTISINNSTGSDTAASGAGPATAVTGAGASLNATSTITLSADTPDLSGVATDGSDAIWVETSSGRQYYKITAVDDGDTHCDSRATHDIHDSSRYGVHLRPATFRLPSTFATLSTPYARDAVP